MLQQDARLLSLTLIFPCPLPRTHTRTHVQTQVQHLGFFDDEVEAAYVYDDQCRRCKGPSCATNFPRPGETQAQPGNSGRPAPRKQQQRPATDNSSDDEEWGAPRGRKRARRGATQQQQRPASAHDAQPWAQGWGAARDLPRPFSAVSKNA